MLPFLIIVLILVASVIGEFMFGSLSNQELVNIVQLPIAYEIEKLNLIFRSTREAGEKIPRPLAFLF